MFKVFKNHGAAIFLVISCFAALLVSLYMMLDVKHHQFLKQELEDLSAKKVRAAENIQFAQQEYEAKLSEITHEHGEKILLRPGEKLTFEKLHQACKPSCTSLPWAEEHETFAWVLCLLCKSRSVPNAKMIELAVKKDIVEDAEAGLESILSKESKFLELFYENCGQKDIPIWKEKPFWQVCYE